MEFDDEELSVLYEILSDEVSDNHHEPSRRTEEDRQITSNLFSKVYNEAKRRKLWWVH